MVLIVFRGIISIWGRSLKYLHILGVHYSMIALFLPCSDPLSSGTWGNFKPICGESIIAWLEVGIIEHY